MVGIAPDDHAEWEKRLGRIADAARQWQEGISGEPATIEAGSDLAEDDVGFEGFGVSHLVGYSLAAATEHLDFTLNVMKLTSTLYPTAYLTVLRTSLLAASHAAWILSPDQRSERQLRALQFLADDVRAQLVMTREALATTDRAHAAKDKMIALLVSRQAELQPIADALKPGLQIAKCQINNTKDHRISSASDSRRRPRPRRREHGVEEHKRRRARISRIRNHATQAEPSRRKPVGRQVLAAAWRPDQRHRSSGGLRGPRLELCLQDA